MADRAFYGGEAPQGGTGEISGGVYQGAGLGDFGAWKCPACRAENSGPLDQGCTSCGSGSARPFKAQPKGSPQIAVAPLPPSATVLDLYLVAQAWADAHPQASLAEAFLAGHQLATARTVQAPPVTADAPTLAPEGKPRRTIIAALRYFRDQVLVAADEEIASGEWCSLADVDALIAQLESEDRP